MKISDHIFEKIEGHKQKIGELLLEHTALNEEQLEEALSIQSESGMMLGDILLKKNYIHSHDIIRVVCYQLGVPYLSEIEVEDIDPNVVLDIPITYAKQHEMLPLLSTDAFIIVALTDPFNFDTINDCQEIFKREVKIVVAPPLKIQDATNRVYEKANRNLVSTLEDEFEDSMDLDAPIDILDAGADEAPVVNFVHSIIFRAVKERASDIHIEPYEKETIYRFRINGVMTEILRQPAKTHQAVSSRIKVMAKLDIAEKRLPQDGRIPIKMAGKDIDLRLSTVPTSHGERIVMRILEKDTTILNLEKLGFTGKLFEDLKELSQRKHGVLYVTGPTGSGKTTTLSAILDRINQPDKMIITVEDPVEYDLAGISQVQVNHKINLTFASVLRAFLRQNPDVIMIGETRDFETAEIAIQSSLTGHLVLSTLHTNDAASAPTRLMDMGVQPFLIASSLIGVLAQRLVQTLCPECKEAYTPTELDFNLLGVEELPAGTTLYRGKGCPKCNYQGYAGRTSVCELLLMSDEIRSLIISKADAAQIKRQARKEGMKTLREAAIEKVLKGLVSVEAMIYAISDDEDDDAANKS